MHGEQSGLPKMISAVPSRNRCLEHPQASFFTPKRPSRICMHGPASACSRNVRGPFRVCAHHADEIHHDGNWACAHPHNLLVSRLDSWTPSAVFAGHRISSRNARRMHSPLPWHRHSVLASPENNNFDARPLPWQASPVGPAGPGAAFAGACPLESIITIVWLTGISFTSIQFASNDTKYLVSSN